MKVEELKLLHEAEARLIASQSCHCEACVKSLARHLARTALERRGSE